MKRRKQNSVTWFVATLILCLDGFALAGATRVALVSTCGGDSGADILSLAEAKLSSEKEIILLERAEVDRVLTEQKLAHCGLGDSAQALAVGKLLGVELFASVETLPADRKAFGLVVFDARTGTRLVDTALPSDGVEKIVETIIVGVRSACEKRLRVATDLRTVCLLTVRNADLPRPMDSLCDAAGLLLERELVASPNLAVLERTQLAHINRERTLPTDAPGRALLASLLTVELEIGRAQAGDGFRATAIVTDNRGKTLAKPTATVQERDVSALIRTLYLELAKALQLHPGDVPAEPQSEALRFDRETHLQWQHRDYVRALRMAEAACALNPGDASMQLALSKALTGRAIEYLAPGRQETSGTVKLTASREEVLRSVELVERALDILLSLRLALVDATTKGSALAPGVLLDSTERFLTNYGEKLLRRGTPHTGDLSAFSPQAQEAIRRVQSKWREYYIGIREKTLAANVKDGGSFEGYTYFLWSVVGGRNVQFWPSSNEWNADVAAVMTRWLALAEQRDLARSWRSGILLEKLTVPSWSCWKLDDADCSRRAELWSKLGQNRDLTLQLYGQIGRMADLKWTDRASPEEILRQVRDLRAHAQDLAAADSLQTDGLRRLSLYVAAIDAIKVLSAGENNSDPRGEEAIQLCEFILARGDLAIGILGETVQRATTSARNETACRLLALADRALKLAQSPEVRVLSNTGSNSDLSRFVGQMNKDRDALVRLCPGQGREVVQPWSEVRELAELAGGKTEIQHLFRPVVAGETVYALGANVHAPSQYLQLFRWSVRDGKQTGLGRVEVSFSNNTLFNAKDAVLSDGRYFAALPQAGVYAFPIDGSDGERIGGLPSDRVQSLACVKGRLYAGASDGYLLAYDLKSKACHALSSSRRKERQSPFDDRPQFSIPCIFADPDRDRIVFLICVPLAQSESSGSAKVDTELSGLWEFRIAAREFRKLQTLNLAAHAFRWAGNAGKRQALIATDRGTLRFDLTEDRAEILYRGFDYGGFMPAIPLAEKTPRPTRLTDRSLEISPPYLLHDGWFWSAEPFGRISMDGSRREVFPSLRKKPSSFSFQNPQCLQAIGDGKTILISDDSGMWLLTLK